MVTLTPSSTSRVTSAHNEVIVALKPIFKQQISIKLDETNYLQRKQQVIGVLCNLKMVKYVITPQIPGCFLTNVDRDTA